MPEEAGSEAHLSAQRPQAGQAPRVPQADVHPRRPGGVAIPSAEGTPSPLGLIWRVRDRSSFVELARRGRRAGGGAVRVTHLDGLVGQPPRVAFAIGRHCGGAVARNRLRRRLRAVVAQLAADGSTIGPGTYLIGATPEASHLSHEELHIDLQRALSALRGTQAPAQRWRS